VKYWLYLVAKIAVVIGITCLLEALLISFYPKSHKPIHLIGSKLSTSALVFCISTFMIWWIGSALLFLAIVDQRRRCRTCLRKLVMPIETGSWANVLMLGLPRIAFICPYGHGTLTVGEVHLSGWQPANWQPHDENIWKELESYGPLGSGKR
jgi:hypothetical protein